MVGKVFVCLPLCVHACLCPSPGSGVSDSVPEGSFEPYAVQFNLMHMQIILTYVYTIFSNQAQE